jgi:hypothetical protein
MMRPVSFSVMLRCIGVLAATIALVGVQPAQAMRPRSIAVTAFYATTKADYDKRVASTRYIPVKHSTLPTGTTYVGLAWFWTGASKTSLYYVVLRHHTGSTIDVFGPYKLGAVAGNGATWFRLSGSKSFADGTYDADLIVGDVLAASTTVTIGGAGGGSGRTVVGGVTVSMFFSTTSASLAVWKKQTKLYPLPKVAARFPAGTTETAFWFMYKGATVNVTTFEIMVHGPNGLVVKGPGPTKFTYASGEGYAHRSPPQGLAYPNGSYTAVILIGGTQASQTSFTIG